MQGKYLDYLKFLQCFVFHAGLFSSSDRFTGCSGVVVKVLNMSKTCQTHTSFYRIAEVSKYVLRLKYEFFGAEYMIGCFNGDNYKVFLS